VVVCVRDMVIGGSVG